MIRLALVDDDEKYLAQVAEYINRFGDETGEKFMVTRFSTGMDFITDYRPVYDIVFLDIEMPLLDGMMTAKKLRELDQRICIVFITNMHKYAIEGYAVNAIDFVVKPLKYPNFADKLKKAISFARMNREREVLIKEDEGYRCLPVSQIYYIEKDKNYLIYHTKNGTVRERGTLERVTEELSDCGFSKCNSGCFVNLRFVERLTALSVIINGEDLPLSRRRMKEFKADFLNYLRGGA